MDISLYWKKLMNIYGPPFHCFNIIAQWLNRLSPLSTHDNNRPVILRIIKILFTLFVTLTIQSELANCDCLSPHLCSESPLFVSLGFVNNSLPSGNTKSISNSPIYYDNRPKSNISAVFRLSPPAFTSNKRIQLVCNFCVLYHLSASQMARLIIAGNNYILIMPSIHAINW